MNCMRLGLVSLAAILLSSLAVSPLVTRAEPSRKSLRNDARLTGKVTISSKGLYLGELLDRISAVTEIPVYASDRLEPNSGRLITAVVRQKTAYDVMEALEQLYSTRADRYFWKLERKGDSEAYVLQHTVAASATRQRREAFIQDYLIRFHQHVSQFYDLPPQRRVEVAANDPALSRADTPKQAVRFSFVKDLSPEQLRAVLSGRLLSVPFTQLSSAQQAYVQQSHEMRLTNGQEEGNPPDANTHIEIFRDDVGTTPLVVVRLGKHGAIPILGGMPAQNAERDWLEGQWSPARVDPSAPNEMVAASRDKTLGTDPSRLSGSPAVIARTLGERCAVDLLYDRMVQRDETAQPEVNLPNKLSTVLGGLKEQFVWRHAHPFLLLRRPDWGGVDLSGLVPWPTIRRLREAAANDEGYLSADQWRVMAEMPKEQLHTLEREFPDARAVSRFQILLRLEAAMNAQERLKLEQPEGVGWADLSAGMRKRLLVLFQPEEARAVRLVYSWRTAKTRRVVQVFLGSGPIRPLEIALSKRGDLEEQPPRPSVFSAPTR